MLAQRATADHYDNVVTSTVTLPGVFVFVKDCVPRSAQSLAMEAWGDVDTFARPSVTRRAAAGPPSIEAFRAVRDDVADIVPATATTCHLRLTDGRVLRQPMSNPVRSYLAGYGVDRFTKTARANMLTNRYPDRWALSLPFLDAVDDVLATMLPDVHQAMRARAKERHPQWRVGDTAFSSVTINVDYESRYHKDVGDFADGWSALTVIERPSYTGGLYVMPDHRVAIDVRAGDVLLTQSHVHMHGNTAITKHTPDAKRISFVCYLKHALATAVNR